MHCSENILLSVKPDYIAALLNGKKTVELRRRSVRVPPGTRVWLYGTLPMGRIVGCGEVRVVYERTPIQIWESFGSRSGLSQERFFRYFEGVKRGCAIVLGQTVRLQRELDLLELRARLGNFTAPQFFRKIPAGTDELRLLESALQGP